MTIVLIAVIFAIVLVRIMQRPAWLTAVIVVVTTVAGVVAQWFVYKRRSKIIELERQRIESMFVGKRNEADRQVNEGESTKHDAPSDASEVSDKSKEPPQR